MKWKLISSHIKIRNHLTPVFLPLLSAFLFLTAAVFAKGNEYFTVQKITDADGKTLTECPDGRMYNDAEDIFKEADEYWSRIEPGIKFEPGSIITKPKGASNIVLYNEEQGEISLPADRIIILCYTRKGLFVQSGKVLIDSRKLFKGITLSGKGIFPKGTRFIIEGGETFTKVMVLEGSVNIVDPSDKISTEYRVDKGMVIEDNDKGLSVPVMMVEDDYSQLKEWSNQLIINTREKSDLIFWDHNDGSYSFTELSDTKTEISGSGTIGSRSDAIRKFGISPNDIFNKENPIDRESVGDRYLSNGSYNQAIYHYEYALELLAENEPRILSKIGDAYAGIGDLNNAIKYYEDSYYLDPENVKTLSRLCYSYEKYGLLDKHGDASQKLVSLKAELSIEKLEEGKAANLVGKRDVAKKLYKEAYGLRKDNIEINEHLIIIYLESDEFEKAIETLNHTISVIDPDDTLFKHNCIFNKGYAYYQLEDYDNALDCFDNYLLFDDTDPGAYLMAGKCYRKKWEKRKWEEHVKTAFFLDPSDSDIYLEMAEVYENVYYDTDRSLAWYYVASMCKDNPHYIANYYIADKIGGSYFLDWESKDIKRDTIMKEAVFRFSEYLEFRPRSSKALEKKLHRLWDIQDFGGIEETVNLLIEIDTSNRSKLSWLGNYYISIGDYKSAIEHYKYMLTFSEIDRSRMFTEIADAYLESNNPNKAIEYYEKAINEDPTRIYIYRKVADVLLLKNADDHKSIDLYYSEMKAKYPDSAVEISLNEASTYEDLEQYEKAIELYNNMLKNVNGFDLVCALARKGTCLYKLDRKKEYIIVSKEGAIIEDDLSDLFNRYTMALKGLNSKTIENGTSQNTILIYDELLDMYPGDYELYYYLGLLYKYNEDFEKADFAFKESIKYYKIAMNGLPRNDIFGFLRRLLQVYIELKDYEGGEESIDFYCGIIDSYGEPMHSGNIIYTDNQQKEFKLDSNRYIEALEYSKKISKKYSNERFYTSCFIRLKHDAGNEISYERAISVCDQRISVDETDFYAYLCKAQILYDSGNSDDAIVNYEKAKHYSNLDFYLLNHPSNKEDKWYISPTMMDFYHKLYTKEEIALYYESLISQDTPGKDFLIGEKIDYLWEKGGYFAVFEDVKALDIELGIDVYYPYYVRKYFIEALDSDDRDNALPLFDILISRYPVDPYAYYYKGYYLFVMGDKTASEPLLAKARDLGLNYELLDNWGK